MLQETVVYLLSNVPGLPPIVQTVHLLGIAVIMSSVVLLDLRILGLALPSQDVQELTRRVMPFVWWTLPVMLLSGLPFVLARPQRYFTQSRLRLEVRAAAAGHRARGAPAFQWHS